MCTPVWLDDFPSLKREWSSRNGEECSRLTRGSNRKVVWKCAKGHEWEAAVKSRTIMGSGCPYCSGRLAIRGETDLLSVFPDVARLWSPTNDLQPYEVTASSHKKAVWRCPEGHEWQSSVANQVRSSGCRECSKYVAPSGSDSVAVLFPELIDEWSDRNPVPPHKCSVNCSLVEWECRTCHHTWRARVEDRVNGSQCPACSFTKLVTGVNDLNTTDNDVASQLHPECDVDPSTVTRKSAQRATWVCDEGHTYTMSVRAKVKNGASYCSECRKVARTLNRTSTPTKVYLDETHPDIAKSWSPANPFGPDAVTYGSNKKVLWVCDEGHTYTMSVKCRITLKVCPVCKGSQVVQGINDLGTLHPALAEQWSEDNDRDVSSVSGLTKSVRARWNMPCGHVMESSLGKRIADPDNCSVCNGKQVMRGVNDLATTNPELVQQWHPTNTKTPFDVSRGSRYLATWVCDEGHVWDTPVTCRAVSGSGCPVCSNNEVRLGVNDLATTRPDLAAEWHPDNTLSPSDVTEGSNKYVRWVCDEGHEWQAQILMRRNGNGCPVCVGRAAHAGFNDFASHYPYLVKEWHPSKNSKTPDEYTHGSRQKVWWLGACGHEWQASVLNRRNGSGCPRCSNQVSAMEKELLTFIITTLGASTKVVGSDRTVLGGRRELDIYVPEMCLAFEFNGLYWHSEAVGKAPSYHDDKVRDCAAKGVRLIHVWEDDWRDRREAVKNTLLFELGQCAYDASAGAVTREVDTTAAASFLDKNHVNGRVSGTRYVGAYMFGDVCPSAVMVSRVEGDTLHIERLSSKGFWAEGLDALVSDAVNHAKSQGCAHISALVEQGTRMVDVYRDAGFSVGEPLPPPHMYFYKGSRHSPSAFRKDRFRRDSRLEFDPNMDEHQLARLNGIPRIYGVGKVMCTRDVP